MRRVTAIEQLIATITPLNSNKAGGHDKEVDVDKLIGTIHHLEKANSHLTSRLVIAESNFQKRLDGTENSVPEVIKCIVHEGRFFGYATDVILFEELAKTRFKSETQWLAVSAL